MLMIFTTFPHATSFTQIAVIKCPRTVEIEIYTQRIQCSQNKILNRILFSLLLFILLLFHISCYFGGHESSEINSVNGMIIKDLILLVRLGLSMRTKREPICTAEMPRGIRFLRKDSACQANKTRTPHRIRSLVKFFKIRRNWILQEQNDRSTSRDQRSLRGTRRGLTKKRSLPSHDDLKKPDTICEIPNVSRIPNSKYAFMYGVSHFRRCIPSRFSYFQPQSPHV